MAPTLLSACPRAALSKADAPAQLTGVPFMIKPSQHIDRTSEVGGSPTAVGDLVAVGQLAAFTARFTD
jgi:hypothetical protein